MRVHVLTRGEHNRRLVRALGADSVGAAADASPELLDGEEFLRLAGRLSIRATTVQYPMAEAPAALADLAHGRFGGAAVLYN